MARYTGRVRAPFSILRELLGEPDPHADLDKGSTLFVYPFEGQDICVYDFHKEEWGGPPQCRVDARYVWDVSGDEDVEPFCRWLTAKVVDRMRASKTLDDAGRARVNKLLAKGVSLDEAMSRVRLVDDDLAADYHWPLADDDGFHDEPLAAPTPAPTAKPVATPVVRRRKRE